MNTSAIAQELAPQGTLRAAVNLLNFLLVSSRGPAGEPQGVGPDMARAIADRLGVGLQLVPYETPGELADAAADHVWDIGLIGAEPARAERITFTSAYVEIEATYLVPPGSAIQSLGQVDRPGVRIAVAARSAYDLWLKRHIQHATLVHAEGFDATFEMFQRDGLEAMACLRPRLLTDAEKLPGSRILPGQFTTVQQSIGTHKRNTQAAAFLQQFVNEAIDSGLVARLIEQHGIRGLSVAPRVK
ncbi:MAG: transporter substrate-binding domain-containing protein [Limnohabitans sp.]